MRWSSLTALGLVLASPLAAAQPAAAPSAEQVRAAEQALNSVDERRLQRDAAYAGVAADHVAVLLAAPGRSDAQRERLRTGYVYTLAAAGRHDRAEAEAEALLRMRPEDAASYDLALFAAQRAKRWQRASDIVARALRLPVETRLAALTPQRVALLLRDIQADGDAAARVRIAEALAAAGWAGRSEPASTPEWLRLILSEGALDRGDLVAARRLAAEIRGLDAVLRLATVRRYDALQTGSDRLAPIRAAIEREDRATAEQLAAAPEETERLIQRAGFLRSIGRDRAVLDLLLPLMGDIRVVAGRHPRSLWLVNEAAYSLIATGAAGEAAELMSPLFTMDVDANPELVNTSINFVSVLWQAGRSEEALQRAETFMTGDARHASDYGRMWLIANAVCAASDARRAVEVQSWLRRTDGIADSNRSAMLQALLCTGDFAAAERVLLSALEDETTRDSAILWLQDYEPLEGAGVAERLRAAFRTLRDRPAVAAAFARYGHRLRLPLSPVLYGWY